MDEQFANHAKVERNVNVKIQPDGRKDKRVLLLTEVKKAKCSLLCVFFVFTAVTVLGSVIVITHW